MDEHVPMGNLDEVLGLEDGDPDTDLELLGLIPYALPERPPAPEVKQRLMARIRAGEAADEAPDVAPVVPLATRRGAAGAPAPVGSAGAPRWFSALAAALLVAVAGLAAFSAWLYLELDAQRSAVAALSQQLEAASEERQTLALARNDLELRQRHLASQLSLVATPGVEVCPLRPLGNDAPYPAARGLLFLSGPRDEWYVRVANVEPAPEGRAYRLWFVLGDEVIQAGVLHPGVDGGVELAGNRLPPEERMTAALVTLEPAAATPTRPTGPTVLFGDEKMDMI